jgi:hypothetical protein
MTDNGSRFLARHFRSKALICRSGLSWNHATERLAKIPVVSEEGMKRSLISSPRSIQRQTGLIKSFFQLADTKYIPATSWELYKYLCNRERRGPSGVLGASPRIGARGGAG